LYGYPERTQREIADELNISRSYVSRIEKKALAKLRECYEKNESPDCSCCLSCTDDN
nr:helix-turn-helix domain-containing protein [Lachnospiraceae bacterium]